MKVELIASLLISSVGWAALPGKKAPIEKISVEEAFARNVAEQLSLSMALPASEFQIAVDSFKLTPESKVGNVKSVQVLGLGTKRVDGLFSLPVIVQTESIAQEFQATGILKITGPVYVARRALLRGENLASDDLNLITLPWHILSTGSGGVPLRRLVGLRVKSHIEIGEALFPAQLEEPFAVHSGDMVELTLLSGPGVMIRSRAIAKQEGRIGDTIRLEQPDTKKAISGQIIGTKSVEVRL